MHSPIHMHAHRVQLATHNIVPTRTHPYTHSHRYNWPHVILPIASFPGLCPDFISQPWRKIHGCEIKSGRRPGNKAKLYPHTPPPPPPPPTHTHTQGTIGQYFATMHCPMCGRLTVEGVCGRCRGDPQKAAAVLSAQMADAERKYHTIQQVWVCCVCNVYVIVCCVVCSDCVWCVCSVYVIVCVCGAVHVCGVRKLHVCGIVCMQCVTSLVPRPPCSAFVACSTNTDEKRGDVPCPPHFFVLQATKRWA